MSARSLEITRCIHTQVATGQPHPENSGELLAAFKGALAAAPQIAGVVLYGVPKADMYGWATNRIRLRRNCLK